MHGLYKYSYIPDIWSYKWQKKYFTIDKENTFFIKLKRCKSELNQIHSGAEGYSPSLIISAFLVSGKYMIFKPLFYNWIFRYFEPNLKWPVIKRNWIIFNYKPCLAIFFLNFLFKTEYLLSVTLANRIVFQSENKMSRHFLSAAHLSSAELVLNNLISRKTNI